MTVLVAGAGPVGLATALLLAEQGLDVTVLERRDTLTTASRASTWHPPTLDLMERMGLDLSAGLRVTHAQYYNGPDRVAEFDFAVLRPDTTRPYRLHLAQSHVAAQMADRLAGRIVFGAEITAVEQDSAGVTVQTSAGPHRGAILVAADGARSTVRTLLGLSFDGEDYPSRVLRIITDGNLDALLPGIAAIAYVFKGADSCSLLQLPDEWRVVFRLPPGEDEAAALAPAAMRARLARFLPPGAADLRIVSADAYGASRRVASSYRAGRIILAGDAAHVTSTRGGMNMNAGLHDAAAAAHAIAAALHSADLTWLDRYAAVRRHVATDQLIPRTDRTVSGGAGWLETVRARAADPAAARAFLRGTAMLDMQPPLSEDRAA